MAAPSETYVDPAGNANSGAGTIGDPYLDLQYALDTMTRDATNGDRINILAGTDEVLAAALDLTTYGTPNTTAPLIIQGYTTTAGDGGIGGISGNGTYSIIASSTLDAIHFIDMHLHNSGSATIVSLDDFCYIVNCEIDNTTGSGLWLDRPVIINCFIHNTGAFGLRCQQGGYVFGNHFENGANSFTTACYLNSNASLATFNTFSLSGASNGIFVNLTAVTIANNSIYSSSGTGQGIIIGGGGNAIVVGNIIEGFSGVGGIGLQTIADGGLILKGNNAFYNNTTDESLSGWESRDMGGDQSLGASPFTDAANGDFTVDTSVRALAYPTANYPGLSVRSYLDIGALQRQEAGGGGILVHPSMSGGIRG